MRSLAYLASTLLAISPALALPGSWMSNLQKKADSTKVGYLYVYWTTADESVYLSLSGNDDPLGFQSINGGNPIVSPTLGTKAVRDTSVISGVGDDEGKYWIIGTDLKIAETNWDAATRTGSRGILVWESTDLVNWTNERLVTVEDETAGMVWAPDAVWDPEQGQYLVHWASQLYSEDDPDHTGDPTLITSLRYAHTSDFQTFTAPQTYLTHNTTSVIDLSILTVDENTFVRFWVSSGVHVEVSTNGLFGDWAAPQGTVADATKYEGPYPFWDNVVDGTAYLVCDLVGSSPGVSGWESTDPTSGVFARDTGHDLTFMRHGSVVAVTQEQYDALAAL